MKKKAYHRGFFGVSSGILLGLLTGGVEGQSFGS